jgi:hypothetical protein
MDLIERWLDERKLNALFDVVPTLANRGITVALGERGYRTRYSSGTTTVTHSLSRGESFCRA